MFLEWTKNYCWKKEPKRKKETEEKNLEERELDRKCNGMEIRRIRRKGEIRKKRRKWWKISIIQGSIPGNLSLLLSVFLYLANFLSFFSLPFSSLSFFSLPPHCNLIFHSSFLTTFFLLFGSSLFSLLINGWLNGGIFFPSSSSFHHFLSNPLHVSKKNLFQSTENCSFSLSFTSSFFLFLFSLYFFLFLSPSLSHSLIFSWKKSLVKHTSDSLLN